MFCGPVGVEEIIENELNVYPNPSNGIINIENPTLIQSLEVYDFQGKLVFTQELNSFQTSLIVDLANGNYLLSVKTNNGTFRENILINR